MPRISTGKKAKQLPAKSALNALDKTQRTINDYAKLSPINPEEPVATVIQNVAKR